MKILVITNLYPPYYFGGYELGCSRVVDALRLKGHEVKVLTSSYGVEGPCKDGDIYRLIPINLNFKTNRNFKRLAQLFWFDHVGRKVFREVYKEFSPDAVYVWNMVHFPLSIVFLAQSLNIPVHFYLSDCWLSHWEKDGWYQVYQRISRLSGCLSWVRNIFMFLFKESAVLFDRGFKLEHLQCISHFVEQDLLEKGKSVKDAQVIHWGIDQEVFLFKNCLSKDGLKLLYVGQIVEHKGVHIIVEAMNVLVHQYKQKGLTLSIAGKGNEVYIEDLKKKISSYHLDSCIHWVGFVNNHDLPLLYQNHDLMIFSSLWEEPFGITLIEAMASGLGVVASLTGGAKEIIRDGVNALSYNRLNFQDCALQIHRLNEDRKLLESIRIQGRQTVEQSFIFNKMIDAIEDKLGLNRK